LPAEGRKERGHTATALEGNSEPARLSIEPEKGRKGCHNSMVVGILRGGAKNKDRCPSKRSLRGNGSYWDRALLRREVKITREKHFIAPDRDKETAYMPKEGICYRKKRG